MKRLKAKPKELKPLPNQQQNEPENLEAKYWCNRYKDEIEWRKMADESNKNLFRDYCDMKTQRNWWIVVACLSIAALLTLCVLGMMGVI